MIQLFHMFNLYFSYLLLFFKKFIAFKLFKLLYNALPLHYIPFTMPPLYTIVVKKLRHRKISYYYCH